MPWVIGDKGPLYQVSQQHKFKSQHASLSIKGTSYEGDPNKLSLTGELKVNASWVEGRFGLEVNRTGDDVNVKTRAKVREGKLFKSKLKDIGERVESTFKKALGEEQKPEAVSHAPERGGVASAENSSQKTAKKLLEVKAKPKVKLKINDFTRSDLGVKVNGRLGDVNFRAEAGSNLKGQPYAEVQAQRSLGSFGVAGVSARYDSEESRDVYLRADFLKTMSVGKYNVSFNAYAQTDRDNLAGTRVVAERRDGRVFGYGAVSTDVDGHVRGSIGLGIRF